MNYLWHFHQFQRFQFTSSTQILSTHGSIQNCYWGAHAINWKRSLGRLDCCAWFSSVAVSIRFYNVLHGLTWSSAVLWIKPVGCQTFTASHISHASSQMRIVGNLEILPMPFWDYFLIGGPWWPRFAPFCWPQVSMAHWALLYWGRGLSLTEIRSCFPYVCSQGERKRT